MMDEKLKTLVTLAKIKNYTKTAKILSITQPAVTQHIQALENEYGIKIFEKNKKELIPTLQGAILIENAHKFMQLHENLLLELKESQTHLKNISIGITMTATDYLIEDILEICNQIYPNCSINFHTDILTNIYNRLKMYEFDFAIVDGTSSSKKIDSYLLYDDHFCLITSMEHPFASLKNVTLEMIRQEKLILRHKKSNTRELIENYLTTHYDTIRNYNVILELENVSLIKELVSKNYGISIMPYSVCKTDIENQKLKALKITDMHLGRGIYLIYLKKNVNDPLIEAIKALKK